MPLAQKRAKEETNPEPLSPVHKRSKCQSSYTLPSIESITRNEPDLTEALATLNISAQVVPSTILAHADNIQAKASVATEDADHKSETQTEQISSAGKPEKPGAPLKPPQEAIKTQTKADDSFDLLPNLNGTTQPGNHVSTDTEPRTEDSSWGGWDSSPRLTQVEAFIPYPMKTPFPDWETDLSLIAGLAYLWEEHCRGKENRTPLLDDNIPQPWLKALDMREAYLTQAKQSTVTGPVHSGVWYKIPSSPARRPKSIFEQKQEWLVTVTVLHFTKKADEKIASQGDP